MEGKKILDLSDLTDEHFNSVQKAVYQCKGSGEPGTFTFVTHRECDETLRILRKGISNTFSTGIACGAVALASGLCVGFVINKTIKHVKAKKLVKKAEKL